MTLAAGKTSSFCRYLITGYTIFLLVVIPSFAGAAEKQPGSPAAPAVSLRYRVFNLKHITAKQATEYLQMINIETKTQILNTNMLSVSAEVNCLVKASELINVVDAPEKYMIKTITLPPDANGLPSYKKISEGAGTVLIGSFADPPMGIGTKVIANLESGNLLLAAPVSIFSRIEQNITDSFQPADKKLRDANTPPTIQDFNQPIRPDVNVPPEIPDANNIRIIDVNTVEITEVNDSNLDNLLSRLVSSLEKPAETKPKTTEGITATIKEAKAGEPAVKEKEQVTERQEPNKPMPQQSQLRPYEPPEISDPNQPLGITLPEKLTIEDLLRLAGEILELNYMYDPALVKGEVTIRISGKLKGELKRKDLYPLIESVLKFKGLAMTRNRNLVIIAPKEQAKDIDPLIIDTQKGGIQYGDVIISRIFDLKYIDAESAKNLLAGMNLAVDINTSASAAGKIIVTGYAFRMKRVEELIELVDKPGEMKQFRFRQLKYTMAATLKDKIKSLAEQLGTISITIAAQSTQQPVTTTIQRRPTVRMPVPQVMPGAQQTPMPTSETPSVYLDVDERTNRILMIGLPEQLDIVEELIGILDVEQQDLRSLRLYEIQHVDAEEVVKKLQELGIITAGQLAAGRTRQTYQQQQQSGLQRPTPGTPPAGARITETPSPPGTGELEPLTEEPQVVIIESTNSLLVNATAEQHLRIATIIGYVDNEPEQATINYVVYPLENQDPEDLAKVLNDLISQTIERTDAAGKIERTTTRTTEEDITILADKNTFSIIVYANKRNQQWIESLIKQLDKRRPQVLIDVTLVEIRKDDDFTLDLDLVTKYPTIPLVGSGQVGLAGSSIPDRRLWEASSISGVGAKAFYADEHIQALLGAMNKKGYGRILAKPKLLVNDNEKGTINTSTIQTIVSPKTTVIPGSGTSNPTATVDVSMKEYTAEIKLDITPHISEGDLLRLEIAMTRTDFKANEDYELTIPGGTSGTLKGPTPPDLLTSNVQTVITVPDQRTIILGGLEKLNQTKGGIKVPILGDIPIVGGLFRNVANTDSQNRLYIFVKANVLRPETKINEESDIVKISHKGREEFEKYESEMQKYEDWPGIKPKPMDPNKILEKD
jgi:type II secretory pathway component GspD/PulD (secretin)